MTDWVRPAGEGVLAVAALVLAVVCANVGTNTAPYHAMAEGAPPFEVTAYNGLWITGAAVLVALAGILIVDAIRRSFEISRRTSSRETSGE